MSNLQEKAENYARKMWGVYFDDVHPDSAITETLGELTQKDFIAGYEFANRWIPIEESKPSQQGHYLVKCKTSFPKNCDVVVAEFYDDNQTFYSESSDYPINDATHWRSI
jgi:RNA recognition motif-containing protein